MTGPVSPAAPGARPDTVIDTAAEVGERKLHELVDAWISAMNRIPKYLRIIEEPPPPPMGGEDAPSTVAVGGLLGVLSRDLRSFAPGRVPSPWVALNRRVVHPFFIRRRMLREARALGLDGRFARVLADRFTTIWRSGVTHDLPRDQQTTRIVELLQREA